MNKSNGQDDFIAQGFYELDEQFISHKAPKITTFPGYNNKSDSQKALYMQKLAATMNHAAKLVSVERDKLVELLVLKDKQLEKLAEMVRQNDSMLQSEVARMNTQRQQYHENVSKLNARIRELKNGDKY